ncbi:unnamed protein product, partial [Pleuronectes platessa]
TSSWTICPDSSPSLPACLPACLPLRPPPRALAQRDTVKAERVLVEQPLSDRLLLNYGNSENQSFSGLSCSEISAAASSSEQKLQLSERAVRQREQGIRAPTQPIIIAFATVSSSPRPALSTQLGPSFRNGLGEAYRGLQSLPVSLSEYVAERRGCCPYANEKGGPNLSLEQDWSTELHTQPLRSATYSLRDTGKISGFMIRAEAAGGLYRAGVSVSSFSSRLAPCAQ